MIEFLSIKGGETIKINQTKVREKTDEEEENFKSNLKILDFLFRSISLSLKKKNININFLELYGKNDLTKELSENGAAVKLFLLLLFYFFLNQKKKLYHILNICKSKYSENIFSNEKVLCICAAGSFSYFIFIINFFFFLRRNFSKKWFFVCS